MLRTHSGSVLPCSSRLEEANYLDNRPTDKRNPLELFQRVPTTCDRDKAERYFRVYGRATALITQPRSSCNAISGRKRGNQRHFLSRDLRVAASNEETQRCESSRPIVNHVALRRTLLRSGLPRSGPRGRALRR